MKVTKTLPETYSLAWEADVEKDKRLMWLLQLLAIPWALVVLLLLGIYAYWFRADVVVAPEITLPFWAILAILAVTIVTIILHELVHGVLFWLYTRERPKFGFKLLYAYASAPDWYFSTSIYWLIGLGPLVFLSLVGMTLLPFIPHSWLPYLLLGIFLNAAGAIGDLYIVIRLAFEPAGTFVQDKGTGFRVFRPIM
ncbi:MAG: DUF3267 domain-containing protein [Anaerolineales bacterium]